MNKGLVVVLGVLGISWFMSQRKANAESGLNVEPEAPLQQLAQPTPVQPLQPIPPTTSQEKSIAQHLTQSLITAIQPTAEEVEVAKIEKPEDIVTATVNGKVTETNPWTDFTTIIA